MSGYVVLLVACLVTAALLPLLLAWSRLNEWRYPRREDVVPGEPLTGPFPEVAVELWAAHDPTPLGFVHLGEMGAGPYLGKDAVSRLWVDQRTRTTVAIVTVSPGGLRATRRAFATFHGDEAEPDSVQVSARSSAMVDDRARPGSQTLYWSTASQAELLRIHQRQLLALGPAAIPVSSLEDVRLLTTRAQDLQRSWLTSSGILSEAEGGMLRLSRRALISSLWRMWPTMGAGIRRTVAPAAPWPAGRKRTRPSDPDRATRRACWGWR